MKGEIIRELRKMRGLSQIELSTLAGITQTTVSNIESGKKNAHRSTELKLCNFLEIPIQLFDLMSVDLKDVPEINKPKELILEFEEGRARVTSTEVELIMPGTNSIIFSGDELKRINDAFTELQPF